MQPQILVPLDGSALAEGILPHAQAVAAATGRGLTLLRVMPTPAVTDPLFGMALPVGDVNALETADLKAGDSYVHVVAGRLGAKVQTAIMEGEPAAAILSYTLHHPEVELIAMATHGRTGLGRWVLGSVAEAVLRDAVVPVLLIRPGADLPAVVPPVYQVILVPLDGSEFAAQALDPACALAAATGATLLLLTVDEPQPESILARGQARSGSAEARQDGALRLDEYLRATSARLVGGGLPVLTHRAQGDPAAAILDTSEHQHCDLIVMATHGRQGVQRLRFGSVALQVVQGTTRPVLLYCRKADPARQTEHAAAPLGVRMAPAAITA